MNSHAAATVLAGLIEADGGIAYVVEDVSCPSNLRGKAGNKPFRIYVAAAQEGLLGQYKWTITVPVQVLDDDLDITVLGAIKSPMVCTYIFMPRAFLRILGTREGNSVWVGLSVNPLKGGFVTEGRPWPIIQNTSTGFPAEPVPYANDQGQKLVLTVQ
jgi:hypothetical protein